MLGKVARHGLIRRRDAVQDNRAHAFGMKLEKDPRRPRSIRTADDVDLSIAERPSDVFQIIHRNRSRVELEVGFWFQLLETFAYVRKWKIIAEIALQITWIKKRAVQRIRAAGTALVHEYQVAVLTNLRHLLRHVRGVFGGRRSRPAGNVEERVWRFVRSRGGIDNYLQSNLATAFKITVFENFKGPTPRFVFDCRIGTGYFAGYERNRRCRRLLAACLSRGGLC